MVVSQVIPQRVLMVLLLAVNRAGTLFICAMILVFASIILMGYYRVDNSMHAYATLFMNRFQSIKFCFFLGFCKFDLI